MILTRIPRKGSEDEAGLYRIRVMRWLSRHSMTDSGCFKLEKSLFQRGSIPDWRQRGDVSISPISDVDASRDSTSSLPLLSGFARAPNAEGRTVEVRFRGKAGPCRSKALRIL
jgi:hypothetical protein